LVPDISIVTSNVTCFSVPSSSSVPTAPVSPDDTAWVVSAVDSVFCIISSTAVVFSCDPVISAPGVTGLRASGPGVSGPGVSGPGVSGPGASCPGVSGPGVFGPEVSGPGVFGPGVYGPGVSGPGVSGPEVSGPRASETLSEGLADKPSS